jgi:hypothetical protein
MVRGTVNGQQYVWDTNTLTWVKMTQAASGASGGDVNVTNTSLAVTAASLPLPTGASTSARQDTANTSLASLDGKAPALGQALAAASVPVVLPAAQLTTLTPPAAITGFATETTLGTRLTESDFDTKVGSLTEGAPASDTASSGLNGRLQRIAQRLTSLIALLPTALTGNNALRVEQVVAGPTQPVSGTFWQVTQPVSAVALPLPSNAAIETGGNLATLVAKDFATSAKQDTGNASLAAIAAVPVAQGTSAVGVLGPLVQAMVADTPQSYCGRCDSTSLPDCRWAAPGLLGAR